MANDNFSKTAAPTPTSNDKSLLEKGAGLIPVVGGFLDFIPKDIYDKTFGAIFSNGFNLKCWGATWNPTKAENVFLEEAQKVKSRLSVVLSQTTASSFEKAINDFWVYFYGIQAPARDWLNTSAKDCTKDGLKILIGALDGLAAQCKNSIDLYAQSKGFKVKRASTRTTTYAPDSAGRHALTYNVPQYEVSKISGSILSGGGFKLQTAGFGVVGGLILISLVAGTIYYNKKNGK